jgi:hypothetical protein
METHEYDQGTNQRKDPESTTWHFVPSGAHSSVGQAERMIRFVKQTLEAVTASRKPEFTKLRLQRLMSSVANIIIDVPLGIHLNNIGKLDAARLIRLNDLILGRCSGNISELLDFESISTPEQADYTKLMAMNKTY